MRDQQADTDRDARCWLLLVLSLLYRHTHFRRKQSDGYSTEKGQPALIQPKLLDWQRTKKKRWVCQIHDTQYYRAASTAGLGWADNPLIHEKTTEGRSKTLRPSVVSACERKGICNIVSEKFLNYSRVSSSFLRKDSLQRNAILVDWVPSMTPGVALRPVATQSQNSSISVT